MSNDARTHRRRAAVAVFGPLLAPAELERVLADLDNRMQGNHVSDVIACVDALAARSLIDGPLCKRLYGELFKALQQPAHTLPPDPWANRRVAATLPAARPAAAVNPPAPPAVPVTAPATVTAPVAPPAAAAPSASPAVPPPAPVTEPPAAAAVTAPTAVSSLPPPVPPPILTAEEAVFAALNRNIRSLMQQFHSGQLAELEEELPRQIKRERFDIRLGAAFLAAWHHHTQLAAWRLGSKTADRAMLVHLLYLALCEVLGPVDADALLAQAVQDTEHLPEARQHSPRLFL